MTDVSGVYRFSINSRMIFTFVHPAVDTDTRYIRAVRFRVRHVLLVALGPNEFPPSRSCGYNAQASLQPVNDVSASRIWHARAFRTNIEIDSEKVARGKYRSHPMRTAATTGYLGAAAWNPAPAGESTPENLGGRAMVQLT